MTCFVYPLKLWYMGLFCTTSEIKKYGQPSLLFFTLHPGINMAEISRSVGSSGSTSSIDSLGGSRPIAKKDLLIPCAETVMRTTSQNKVANSTSRRLREVSPGTKVPLLKAAMVSGYQDLSRARFWWLTIVWTKLRIVVQSGCDRTDGSRSGDDRCFKHLIAWNELLLSARYPRKSVSSVSVCSFTYRSCKPGPKACRNPNRNH